MSDYDRSKFYPKKKFASTSKDPSGSTGRNFFNSKSHFSKYDKEKDSTSNENTSKIKQPIILIKPREVSNEEVSASPKKTKDSETEPINALPTVLKENEAPHTPTPKQMTKSMKLLEDGIICADSLLDFLQENSDFTVVGVVGCHGVGKSTILNLLAQNEVDDEVLTSLFQTYKEDEFKLLSTRLSGMDINDQERVNSQHNIFKVETVENIESNTNCTQEIDIYISPNRVIFLDCQPLMSVSVLEELVQSENKRSSIVSEYIPLENSGEIQGLQLTAFLMSVCHVLLVVQDWFFDSNIVRFIQSAEMLKPTISNPEDELIDHFPNLILVHNNAQMEDFTPKRFKLMQDIYKELFSKTKLHINTNLGLSTGRIMHTLSSESCGSPINLYLIPQFQEFDDCYRGHPPLQDLIKKLRANILGATKTPLTHVQLTEKTWLSYCSKVWENVKKSSFFVEYTKLMP